MTRAGKSGKITIREIAKEAGVSATAVSFFLNGKAEQFQLAPETCERIERVVSEHNYQPNIHARAMANKVTYLVGVMFNHTHGGGLWSAVFDGLTKTLEKNSYHIIFTSSNDDTDREAELFDFMVQKGVDAFIYVPVMQKIGGHSLASLKRAIKKPTVSILHPVEGVPSVFTDHTIGGRMAAEELYKLGHRKVAYIGHVTSDLGHRFDERFRSFKAFYDEAGIEVPHYESVADAVPHAGKYTAIFCFSDHVAAKLYGMLNAAGMKIPDDISVMGYGHDEYIQPILTPKLTTIFEHKENIGQRAAEIALQMVENKTRLDMHEKLPPYLVEGNSLSAI